MRPHATLIFSALLLGASSGLAAAQDPPPPAPAEPRDSLRDAKTDREAAERAAKDAELARSDSARDADADREAAKRAAKDAERARKEAENAPPTVVVVGPLPREERLTLSVAPFRFGTATNQAAYALKIPRGAKVGTVVSDAASLAHEDNLNLGVGVADLLKAELTRTESFRIIERLPETEGLVEVAPRPRLIVTGSITRFGTEDKTIGGGGILKKALGGLGVSKKRTVVELTGQVLDAATGEVLLSVTGFGISRKGGGLVVVGGTQDGVAGGGTSTQAATVAIGEATRLAAQDLAAKITNAREALLRGLNPS